MPREEVTAPAVPPGRAGGRRRLGTLPAEVTGFVGRAAELARITDLLAGARLVTVVGPPGVGKTRVSVRAAALAADRYPDGVWLAELSGLRDPALLAATVAGCLGLPRQDGSVRQAALPQQLRDRRLLLVLDTCEHLIDACAEFAEAVLREAPRVTLLATSRQPLDVPGEHIYPVAPLPVPGPDDGEPPGAGPGTAAARGADSVELFAQRAAAASPGFAVTAANRADVVRLCRRLDGIPLAIELAAIRLRALSLPDLAARLEAGFGVLAGDRRGGTPRHQTLRTAVDWSHRLCTPAEQALWARLSVFAGGFDVAAAEQVCADADMPRDMVIETLIGLVDKSVVLRDRTDEGRYLLPGPVREFGADRLAESGQQAACRGRLIARCLAMATRFEEHLLDDDQTARYRELLREHAGLQEALEYSLGRGEYLREGASLAIRLHRFWQISGMLREGRHWLGRVAELFPEPCAERAWALGIRGRLATYQGDLTAALDDIAESIRLAGELGEDLARASGYLYLNLALIYAGRHEEAAAAGHEARRQMEDLRFHTGLATLEPQMARLHQLSGNPDLAVEYCERGLRLLGDHHRERWLTSYLHLVTGLALFQQPGREAECAAAIRTSLLAKHELGDVVGIAYGLEVLGWLAADAGRPDEAAWLLGAAEPLWERTACWLGNVALMEDFRQRAVSKARGALGDRRYAVSRAQGAGQPLDLVVNRAVGDGTAGLLGPEAVDPVAAGLTRREQEIAGMVASGLSNREIAARLFISKRTVDAHVEHIFAKLEISSRVQLTVWLQDRLPKARTTAGHPLSGYMPTRLPLDHARQ